MGEGRGSVEGERWVDARGERRKGGRGGTL